MARNRNASKKVHVPDWMTRESSVSFEAKAMILASDDGFPVLRDGSGRPVTKNYPDLKPGEVNYVLK